MGKVLRRTNNFIHHYLDELASRIVATSGRPSDRFHLGKLVLSGLKDAPQDFVLQVDAGTGVSETVGSVLERSVRCATCLQTLGLGCGDVIVLMAPNNLDLCIPFYAAMFLGITVSPLDWTLGAKETAELFKVNKPNLIFCLNEHAKIVKEAIELIQLKATIITFDESDICMSYRKFQEKYATQVTVDEFKPAEFDTEEVVSFLVSTSGTTGLPKAAVHTYKTFSILTPYLMCLFEKFPTPTRMCMVIAPIQWLSPIIIFLLSAMVRFTRVQTSKLLTPEHTIQLIRKYQPTFGIMSPPSLTSLMKSAAFEEGDLASFEVMLIGGSALTDDVIKSLKEASVNTQFISAYGMSETGVSHFYDGSQQGLAFNPVGILNCRLVDPSTGLDIEQPNMQGELWLTGPTIFKGYQNTPEETKNVFSKDGWLKTGDIFYGNENGDYFYVERLKTLLKYRVHQVAPLEVEAVIRQHPSVIDAAVTGIPDECGDLVVACVVRRPHYNVTAQEIKDLVKDTLADSKRLRGGVIFLDKLPMTANGKISRNKLRELVLQHERL